MRILRLTFISFLVLTALSFGQNVRYDRDFTSISSTVPPFVVANVSPNLPTLQVCTSPANGVPCTNYATTYTSAGVACPNGAQDTPQPQPSACQSTGDAQGNIGFWAPAGQYDYTVCISTSCFGPYTVTLGGSGGGGSGANVHLSNLNTTALNASLFCASSGSCDLGSKALPFGGGYFLNGIDIFGTTGTGGVLSWGSIIYATFSPDATYQWLLNSGTGPYGNYDGGYKASMYCMGTDCITTWPRVQTAFENCTADQTGNSFPTVTTLTNYFNAHWEFVYNTTTYINCQIYIPVAPPASTISGITIPSSTIVVDVYSADGVAGHTANIQTCDAIISASGNFQTGALTCAANQTYTTTASAYSRTSLTFNVQSTLVNGGVLIVKIGTSPTGTPPTSDILIYPHFVL